MWLIAQNYKSGELSLLEVPVPACRPGGVLVRTAFSVISSGTEMMKISESKLSLFGKARARPDQMRKVIESVRQQGLLSTYHKVMSRLDSYTPLGYSLSGTVVEVGGATEHLAVGQRVACAGNQYALHAEYNWVPTNMCVPIPAGVDPEQAAFTTVASVALQGMRQSEVRLGETACVVGLGLLGQILVRLLRGAGVFVVGVDVVEDRCNMAEAAGAGACAVSGTDGFERVRRKIADLTGGQGVDCTFITAGGSDSAPVLLAAELSRDRARVIDIGKCRLDLPWNDCYEKELDFRFSRSYGPGRYDPLYEEAGIDYPVGYVRWTERRNMECILALLAEGRLNLKPLITDVFPFKSAVQVYARMNTGALSGPGVLFRYGDQAPIKRVTANPLARPMRSGNLRLGVIGAGSYASSMLLPHLAADPRVDLVAVATNSALSAANAMRKFRFSRASTDGRELITATDIDAVLIATRHGSHAQLACEALRSGKAVFVEKPLAITKASLAEIIRTVQETGNDRLTVGFNRRFSPLLVAMKAEWGPRTAAHVIQYRVNAGLLEKGSWYANPDEGSRFVGEGGHFIDTASWWLGTDPSQVSVVATSPSREGLIVTLAYADGSIASISYVAHGNPRVPKERIEIFGDGKAASFDNFSRYELWRSRRTIVRRSRIADKGQRHQLAAFIEAVKSGGPMAIPFSSLVATTTATLAVEESIAANAPIPVQLAGNEQISISPCSLSSANEA
ncbi:MAG TPA: bi-domain-containing oxidoreductase [Xanthobacteraceae bacterium]|jgi:predicted dehydrogenase/threonine dehydrogenase-like Zn-dependent dehydrogenase